MGSIILISGDAAITTYSEEFVALVASQVSLLDSRFGNSIEKISESDEAFAQFTEMYTHSISRLLLAVGVEREFLRKALDASQLSLIYRCMLDPSRAPITERWSEESGCRQEMDALTQAIPSRLKEYEKALRELYDK